MQHQFLMVHPLEIDDWCAKAGVPRSGKTYLYDGGTGERFHQTATVGHHIYA